MHQISSVLVACLAILVCACSQEPEPSSESAITTKPGVAVGYYQFEPKIEGIGPASVQIVDGKFCFSSMVETAVGTLTADGKLTDYKSFQLEILRVDDERFKYVTAHGEWPLTADASPPSEVFLIEINFIVDDPHYPLYVLSDASGFCWISDSDELMRCTFGLPVGLSKLDDEHRLGPLHFVQPATTTGFHSYASVEYGSAMIGVWLDFNLDQRLEVGTTIDGQVQQEILGFSKRFTTEAELIVTRRVLDEATCAELPEGRTFGWVKE